MESLPPVKRHGGSPLDDSASQERVVDAGGPESPNSGVGRPESVSTESLDQLRPAAGRGDDAAVGFGLTPFVTLPDADEKADTVIRRPSGGSSARPAGRAPSSSPADVASVLLGSQLSHFHLEELIGGGGMGAVFRARDERLDRTVAIKVIPFIGDDPDMQRRFRNEAQAAARLDHPNIARVYDVGTFEGWRYIVFEYIEGINIRDLVARDGVLSIDDAVFCTRQIAEALHHASGRGVVHRDVKPSNILVNSEGETKLVDMGLARSDQLEISGDMTASGVTLGTFDYISPEQARDPRDADVRSDLYSLGCTLNFMLTGEPPYPGGTVLQKLLNHGNAPPPNPQLIRPDISDDLKAILHKMLAKAPEVRYQRAIDLVADLRELAAREGLVRAGSQGTVAITPENLSRVSWAIHLPWLVAAILLLLGGAFLQLTSSLRGDSFVLEIPASAVGIRSVESGETATRPNSEGTSPPPLSADAGRSAPREVEGVFGSRPASESFESGPMPSRDPDSGRTNDAVASDSTVSPSLDMPRPLPTSPGDSDRPSQGGDEGSPPTDVALAGPRFSDIAMPRETLPAAPSDVTTEPAAPIKVDRIVVGPADRSWPENAFPSESLVEALRLAEERSINLIELAVPVIDSPPIRIPQDGLIIRSLVGSSEIRFSSDTVPAMQRAVMVDIGPHRIDFQNLHFSWQVRSSSIEGGSLFSLSDNRMVRLTGCTITIENLAERDDVFGFEIVGSAAQRMIGDWGQEPFGSRLSPDLASSSRENENRPSGRPVSPRAPILPLVAIELNHVACRGEMSLMRLSDVLQLQFRWDNGLLAISGRMLEVAGPALPVSSGGSQVQLRLSNVTASTGAGLVRARVGITDTPPISIDRDARSVVFRSPAGAPHIELIGLEPNQHPLDSLISLRGEDNAYDLEPEGDWPILDLTMAAEEKQVFWMSQMVVPSRPPWIAERSPRWVVRWSELIDDQVPASRRTLADFYQDGTVVPGFDQSSLPNFPQR